ncbi:transcriptional regulator [Morganella morganii]|uniref:Transcriptional regulator n=1 Tax=Morganella morganii TaxID=582 RepID=A0A433ZUJ6_MORMO|nr:ROK family protein [Morganella morganii]RUT65742.1 transcriptional regulator [Morganella morganii]
MKPSAQPGHIDHIKQTNMGVVYRYIDREGPISRISLSKKAQLAPASITKITRELMDAHLVRETEFPRLGFRGRPAVGLKTDCDGWHFLCIRINKGELVFALRELSGKLLAEDIIDFPANNRDFVTPFLAQVDAFFSRNNRITERLTAIAITTDAIVDPANGIIRHSPYYQLTDLPVAEILYQHTGMPVFLQHGISAWSLAEYFFGAAKECKNIIQLVIDENVGAAIITDGALLHAGSHSTAEIGHTQINAQGKPCYCGNHGCLETEIGLHHVLETAAQFLDTPDGQLPTAAILCRAALDGNTAACELIEKVGQHIGDIAAVMVNIFNPEIILIGSPLNPASSVLFPAIRARIIQRALPAFSRELTMTSCEFNNCGTLPGAALIKEALYNGSLLIKLMDG